MRNRILRQNISIQGKSILISVYDRLQHRSNWILQFDNKEIVWSFRKIDEKIQNRNMWLG